MNNVPYLDLTKYMGYPHATPKILCRLDTATKIKILSDIIKIYNNKILIAKIMNMATALVAIYCANINFS